ncbi:GGDEF domain-containing protein [Aeromonas caviae]|uniref:diguanylate cyclase n=1 Tax=Aeromonas caviae TaxID=648 RepID=A0A7I8I031_AERCA|nr:GGDEF domain-containing protein [Aeromonas caviae]BDA19289.1 GGDEF domain-containing protein [Aeromonas caviae]BDC85832.1 GGDEF domain-containing protein [Aeromonas caviae]BDN93477.1 GGDEF domain-containing protein [Aeromonas caviae]BDO07529.1 GGDEF domain-containing protein [Aeromonas caviae]
MLGQRDLDALLAIFAERVANIVRIHSLQFDCGQPHPLISHPPQARLTLHAYRFELRGRHEQLLGQLHYELEHPLSDGQRRLLEQYHQLFSLPLPLYLRLDRLEQQVRLDHLTGLGNRAYFDEAIGRAVEQHSREPHGLVLVLLDLDRFKQVNDTWGHPVGDLVLSRFAQLLQGCIRGTDQAFRLGGDEFALLLQPADPEAWRPVWLRLQHVLHSHKELSAFSVGCSLGAASWQSGMDVQRLYETADTHLYARKKAGGSGLPE